MTEFKRCVLLLCCFLGLCMGKDGAKAVIGEVKESAVYFVFVEELFDF